MARGGGGEDEDNEFGFAGLNVSGADEELGEGEVWEEVDLDEFGNPIESTARVVE